MDCIVPTPSAENPKGLTVDLEGALGQLLWLRHERKGGTAAGASTNKKRRPVWGG